MELSNSKIKKILIFPDMEPCTLQLEKIKKFHPKKISYIPGKWSFLTLILKKFLYFLKRMLFLYSRKRKPGKFFLYFLERKLFVYFRKRKPRKNSLYFRKRNFLIFQERIFRALKIKRTHSLKSFLFFREIKLKSLKNFLCFRKELTNP